MFHIVFPLFSGSLLLPDAQEKRPKPALPSQNREKIFSRPPVAANRRRNWRFPFRPHLKRAKIPAAHRIKP
ncbi:hypothetical protein, partial [Leisingera sp. JC1]|uniref:hypothetical protein n=1 Tax=Leisingera sp. JC1 TaxID=1855282 RepID=UPI001C3095E5